MKISLSLDNRAYYYRRVAYRADRIDYHDREQGYF
jgi:hypothetical protein